MRFILGSFSSALSPASYSLIADYFPLEYRSTAVSIENAGNYFGAALSSLSILFIDQYGWRQLYKLLGLSGIACGIVFMIIV